MYSDWEKVWRQNEMNIYAVRGRNAEDQVLHKSTGLEESSPALLELSVVPKA